MPSIVPWQLIPENTEQRLSTFALGSVIVPNEMTGADRARSNAMNPMTDEAFVKKAFRINAEDKRISGAEAARTKYSDVKALPSSSKPLMRSMNAWRSCCASND